MGKISAPAIRAMKGARIVCLTAYDAPSAAIAELAGVDVILVGDSVGNTVLGHSSTVPVTLPDMIRHTAAVSRGARTPLIVADLPFGSYQSSTAQAVDSAVALMQAGASAVKLEGDYPEAISAIGKAGIPVMGHVGFTPQSVHVFGGHKVQGRNQDAPNVLADAVSVQEAGAFAIVLELIPAQLAKTITAELRIPTIGIGAGVDCDGEIQVWHDVTGLSPREFKHSKRYANGHDLFLSAIRQYAAEVRARQFPTDAQSFSD